MGRNFIFVIAICMCLFSQTVRTATPADFLKDVSTYRNVCKSLECNTYKGKLIAFQANLQNTLKNVPANTILKFENVKLNICGGYNPKTGIFTAPADGVYSFTWAFLCTDGGSVYIAAMINNDVQVRSCVYRQKSHHISTTGHLVAELKKGNKVWLQIFWIAATYIHGDSYSYFSGNMLQ